MRVSSISANISTSSPHVRRERSRSCECAGSPSSTTSRPGRSTSPSHASTPSARGCAAEELHQARVALDEQRKRIVRRLDDAREDATTTLRSLRTSLEDALQELGEVLDFASHAP
jgi:hypothetical protein